MVKRDVRFHTEIRSFFSLDKIKTNRTRQVRYTACTIINRSVSVSFFRPLHFQLHIVVIIVYISATAARNRIYKLIERGTHRNPRCAHTAPCSIRGSTCSSSSSKSNNRFQTTTTQHVCENVTYVVINGGS